MDQSKKRIFTAVLVLCLLLLQGCGFHLKQSATISNSISPIAIGGLGEYHGLRVALTQLLSANDISVVAQDATTVLRIKAYESERRVLSVDGNGKVAEYELHEGVIFDLIASNGSPLTKEQHVSTQLTYLNSETEVLGKQQEESALRKDMLHNLADRIIRRLSKQL